jgi:hypothetical protein
VNDEEDNRIIQSMQAAQHARLSRLRTLDTIPEGGPWPLPPPLLGDATPVVADFADVALRAELGHALIQNRLLD